MNRYNPYSVPEGFFGDVRKDALARRARMRRTIGLSVGAFLLAALIVAAPHLSGDPQPEQVIASQSTDNLEDMYDCDIFLQVANF